MTGFRDRVPTRYAFAFVLATVVAATAAVPARAKVFSPETFTLENGLQVVSPAPLRCKPSISTLDRHYSRAL